MAELFLGNALPWCFECFFFNHQVLVKSPDPEPCTGYHTAIPMDRLQLRLNLLPNNTFWINKERITRAGFETATSGLTCRRSTN